MKKDKLLTYQKPKNPKIAKFCTLKTPRKTQKPRAWPTMVNEQLVKITLMQKITFKIITDERKIKI